MIFTANAACCVLYLLFWNIRRIKAHIHSNQEPVIIKLVSKFLEVDCFVRYLWLVLWLCCSVHSLMSASFLTSMLKRPVCQMRQHCISAKCCACAIDLKFNWFTFYRPYLYKSRGIKFRASSFLALVKFPDNINMFRFRNSLNHTAFNIWLL